MYTVHQVSGWEGRELMKDFDVFISQNGETYRYLINNANFRSFIKVIKVDAETGCTIPYAGAGFQIYRPDGSLVTMTFTYPSMTTIDTFYTNDEGMLITPESWSTGTGYKLIESPLHTAMCSATRQSPLMSRRQFHRGDAVRIVEVRFSNMPQKGVIRVSSPVRSSRR